MHGVPELLKPVGRRRQIPRKPAEILVQYQKTGLQDQEADVARARQQRLDRIELPLDVDRRSVERTAVFDREECGRQNAIYAGNKIEIIRIALHIEIGTARVRARERRAQRGDFRIERDTVAALFRWLINIHRNASQSRESTHSSAPRAQSLASLSKAISRCNRASISLSGTIL